MRHGLHHRTKTTHIKKVLVVPDNAVDIILDVAKDVPSGNWFSRLLSRLRWIVFINLVSFRFDMYSKLWVEKHDVASIIIGFLNLIV